MVVNWRPGQTKVVIELGWELAMYTIIFLCHSDLFMVKIGRRKSKVIFTYLFIGVHHSFLSFFSTCMRKSAMLWSCSAFILFSNSWFRCMLPRMESSSVQVLNIWSSSSTLLWHSSQVRSVLLVLKLSLKFNILHLALNTSRAL